jgi:hypothetical protein
LEHESGPGEEDAALGGRGEVMAPGVTL